MPQPSRRLAGVLALIAFLGAGLSPWSAQIRAADSSPATTVETVRAALFNAQSALLSGDTSSAQAGTADAAAAAQQLLAALPPGSPAAQRISAGLAAAAGAASSGDATALAAARGDIATAILLGAYETTLAAISNGDAATASTWLLVRDFRPSTRFSRPGADATLAVRGLSQGTVSTADATAAVEADLLDTYQAKLEEVLASASDAAGKGFTTRLAEATAQAAGYWTILAPSYERQFGAEQRAAADTTFATLAGAGRAGDAAGLETARSEALALVEGFRAAPLSADEQARRAGQLLLYLSLVPVEYGRGVKQGQVVVDIEIQEAQTFLDGARAAFNDLRLPLSTLDAARTAEVAPLLDGLQTWMHDAGLHQNVAEPDEVKTAASDAASTLKAIYPSEWERGGGVADFDVVASLLDQMEKAVAAKQYKQAESARLEAYAIFDAGPEKHLLGFAPHLARKIEELFWQGTSDHPGLAYLLQGTPTSGEVRQTRLALDRVLTDSQQVLGSGRPARAAIVFNAATIVFREGLEGVLILASLLASMVGANLRYKRPLAIGAIGALGATAVLFVLARTILLSLGQYGEKLEAIVSLVAIGILLLVMNWFFHKVYWTKWIAKHHNRRRVLIGGAAGQMLGLVVLGFTSVFREGAETVLFLQALVLDAGTWVVIEGTLLGLLGVAVVGALVFVMQKKLPHKKMLIVTGIMIATVLVTMVGTTVHVLQVVGWAPINPVESIQVPFWMGQWFGFYGTWEGILAQSAALIFVVGSYYLAEHAQERQRTATVRGLSTAGSQG